WPHHQDRVAVVTLACYGIDPCHGCVTSLSGTALSAVALLVIRKRSALLSSNGTADDGAVTLRPCLQSVSWTSDMLGTGSPARTAASCTYWTARTSHSCMRAMTPYAASQASLSSLTVGMKSCRLGIPVRGSTTRFITSSG